MSPQMAAPLELEIDHLVVAAANLEEGVGHVCSLLGVDPEAFSPEGKHAAFGTHNRCLGLEGGVYLEVIAVDPAAPPPPRPRWFGLDDPAVQRRLAEGGPQLLSWVARLKRHTGDLGHLAEQHPGLLPPPLPLERGDYKWRICVPADGALPGGGLVPTLIQWDCPASPAERLPPSGLRLLRLTGRHQQAAAVGARLAELGAGELIKVSEAPSALTPSLHAAIWCPSGLGHSTRTLW